MMTGLLENGLSISKVMGRLAVCRKLIPTTGNMVTKAKLHKDLERLALSAPHMLSDIGFERDFEACSGEKTVWRRGTHCVIIFSTTHAAAVFT